MKQWVTLFSQSGKEIADISKVLGRKPDLVVTNNFNVDKYHPSMQELLNTTPIFMAKHDKIMEMLGLVSGKISLVGTNSIITLHGYLRIIPADICLNNQIFNGHPGLITRYPELKGKDPQEKVIQSLLRNENRYKKIGSVVHVCTPELDAGEVVEVSEGDLYCPSDSKMTETYVYETLRMHSLQAWTNFLTRSL